MEAVKKQQLEAAEKLFAFGDLRRARMHVDMAMAMDRSGGGERACGGILKAQDLEPALTGAAQSRRSRRNCLLKMTWYGLTLSWTCKEEIRRESSTLLRMPMI
ncbi:hypothetical protein ZWY2020_037499 [Hordeum vulgare]|nr:hypothetical protein ZWY2020_037499 [Hordeum vulgare]